ncbi:MAG: ABC transporter permease [Rhizobacter sp.]|nr:ABC transporter permease [Chlorobiales bacterium]
MFKNYFKVAWRNLIRHKAYSAINIAGLALGLACSMLMLLYVQHELGYDRFNSHAAQIYRVNVSFDGTAESQEPWTSPPVAPALAEALPEAQAVARFRTLSQVLLKTGDKQIYETGAAYSDPALFDLFTFPVVAGSKTAALSSPTSMVLTESLAKKYFGNESAVGQVLTLDLDGFKQFTVAAVIADVPQNSSVAFTMLLPLGSKNKNTLENRWDFDYTTFIRLSANAEATATARKLKTFAAQFYPRDAENDRDIGLYLQPLLDLHLSGIGQEAGLSNATYVYMFSLLAVVILVIACINFTNLSTARSAKRGKEVGIRKVSGASAGELAAQFLGESMLLSFIAMLLAVILAELFLPLFNQLSGKVLRLSLTDPATLLQWLGIGLVVSLLAGSYPALFLSRFKPVEVLKGKFAQSRNGGGLRKSLVVAQFAISIALIIGTLVAQSQLVYIRTRALGFDREQLVAVPMRGEQRVKAALTYKQLISTSPDIVQASAASALPGDDELWRTGVMAVRNNEKVDQIAATFQVDYEYFKTLGAGFAAGRDFNRLFATDSTVFILNEAAVKGYGWKSPQEALGQTIVWQARVKGKEGKVIGVVKDFNFLSLHQAVEPAVFHISRAAISDVVIRIKANRAAEALAFLRAKHAELDPSRPFEYAFVDDNLARYYQSDENLSRVFGIFAGLAIFIACLGLFGLAAFTAEQRTKEIGVRKVLGASAASITLLLAKDFLMLVAIANVIAWPLAYLAMQKWLESFAYRTEIAVWIFVAAAAAAVAIAFATVSYQAVKAATVNPVKSLRYE